jgi:hypothetical protein
VHGYYERLPHPVQHPIDQRNWRGDIDEPKTAKSKRTLALGALTERYRTWIASLEHRNADAWVFPQDEDKRQPMWDSGVRKALKLAAAAEGCDFLGLGPQEVGGSSIETSQIAGHANTKITEEYTIVQLRRQEELTRRIQGKRQKAAQRSKAKLVAIKGGEAAA